MALSDNLIAFIFIQIMLYFLLINKKDKIKKFIGIGASLTTSISTILVIDNIIMLSLCYIIILVNVILLLDNIYIN